jgi:ABC-2 type transport system permease protein
MKRYYKIWLLLATNSVQTSLASRFNASILILGKLLRFGMFLFFLTLIGSKTKLISGYSLPQIILFFLTYQLLDTLPQLLLREVYRFRGYIVRGDFDYFLVKPFSPLFRALFGGTDILDVPVTVISIIAIIITAKYIGPISTPNIILYFILVVNTVCIAICFHILALSLAVVSTEIDNVILLYRDVTLMGRVPVDIYREPIRSFITFIIPVGIMMTFPAKALLGLLSPLMILLAIMITLTIFFISISVWKKSLQEYSSASS